MILQSSVMSATCGSTIRMHGISTVRLTLANLVNYFAVIQLYSGIAQSNLATALSVWVTRA
jgi:hypothetical protein